MFISLTVLRIKNIFKFPLFMKHGYPTTQQAFKAAGIIRAKTRISGFNAYTITAWESADAMKAYRNSGAHKEAMKYIKEMASSFKSINFEANEFPAWKDAKEKLKNVESISVKK